MVSVLSPFSPVWLIDTPQTVVHEAPLFMEFSREEDWNLYKEQLFTHCSSALEIREIHFKTAVEYTSLEYPQRKKEYNTKFCKNTGQMEHCWCEFIMIHIPLRRKAWQPLISQAYTWHTAHRIKSLVFTQKKGNIATQAHIHNMFLNIYSDFIWKDKHWKQTRSSSMKEKAPWFCSPSITKISKKKTINCWHPWHHNMRGERWIVNPFIFFFHGNVVTDWISNLQNYRSYP